MLPDFATYCHLIADLPHQFPSIQTSTLTVYTIGPFVAEIEGQLSFTDGYMLDVWELIDFSTGMIRSYSYAVDRAGERMWWYDSQSHPDDPTLVATDPHHKHIHSNIKRHRIPTLDVSFDKPNLPFLIREVEQAIPK